MAPSSPLAILRRHWFPGLPADRCGPVLGGGFSGSTVVAVRTPAGTRAVLKAFAAEIPPEHAAWIHRLMVHLTDSGIQAVPRLIATVDRQPGAARGDVLATDSAATTLARGADGRLWELATWMPGAPVARPTEPQARAALATMATIHRAAERLPGEPARAGPAPAHLRRIDAARRHLALGWDALPAATHPDSPLAAAVAARVAAATPLVATRAVRRAIEQVAASDPVVVPLSAVIRDLRAEHVLFTTRDAIAAPLGNAETVHPPANPGAGAIGGVIDFHAAGIDTPATDLARLLGGWGELGKCSGGAEFDEGWGRVLAWYDEIRKVSENELHLVPWLAATAVVFGLDQWFRWVLVERREFRSPADVVGRIDRLLVDLPAALVRLERRPCPV